MVARVMMRCVKAEHSRKNWVGNGVGGRGTLFGKPQQAITQFVDQSRTVAGGLCDDNISLLER